MITTFHKTDDVRIFKKELTSLKNAGYDIDIVAPGKWYKARYLHPLTVVTVGVKAFRGNADVYHTHELGSLAIGIILKLINPNKVLIYDAHECQPSLMAYSIFGRIEKTAFKLLDLSERMMFKHVDKLIVVSESLKDHYSKYHNDITIIPNYPILNTDIVMDDCKDNTVVYTGNVGRKRGSLELKEAATKLNNCKIKIVGSFAERECDNIEVVAHVPYEEVFDHIKVSNAGLILFKPTHFNNAIGLPNKLFEYMACGIPVISSELPEIKRIIATSDCGVLVNPNDPNDIADKINYLIDNPDIAEQLGRNGYNAVMQKYNWGNAEKKLFEIYEGLK